MIARPSWVAASNRRSPAEPAITRARSPISGCRGIAWIRHGVVVEDRETGDAAAQAWLRRVGERARRQRLAAELSREELGAAAGISCVSISLIEEGCDSEVLELWRLADALQAPLVGLLADQDGDL